MNDNLIRRVIASTPVNKTAGVVMSRGIHWESQRKDGDAQHWKAPPKTVPVPDDNKGPSLIGAKVGRFTVVGYLGKLSNKPAAKGRWLVKCTCGDYEARSAKAIKNPRNHVDMCVDCRHFEHIKHNHGRGKGVTTMENNQ